MECPCVQKSHGNQYAFQMSFFLEEFDGQGNINERMGISFVPFVAKEVSHAVVNADQLKVI
jgi:hypothetical protein